MHTYSVESDLSYAFVTVKNKKNEQCRYKTVAERLKTLHH